MVSPDIERLACTPEPIDRARLNEGAIIPYGCTTEHIFQAMKDFVDFLGYINGQLHANGYDRMEGMLLPANFSSLVGEFLGAAIPKYCPSLVRNTYPSNGHPDLLVRGRYPNNSAQHAPDGIEIKASRYQRGWQGHNPEDVWLLIFVFDANGRLDSANGIPPRAFRFIGVLGAALTREDWQFSGRSAASRRTITASVKRSGFTKMSTNWIYR